MRSGVGLSRQIAGEEPRNSSPDLSRVACLTYPRKRGTKDRRRAPNGTSAATAGRHAWPLQNVFQATEQSLDPNPDFDIMPRSPVTSRGDNRGAPDSSEELEPSCSAEGLVTPLLGTQSVEGKAQRTVYRHRRNKPPRGNIPRTRACHEIWQRQHRLGDAEQTGQGKQGEEMPVKSRGRRKNERVGID